MASVTNTYARAFADVVVSGHLDAARTLAEAQAISELVASSKPLREVWETPSIPAAQKRAVLDSIVAREGFSKPVRNLVAVLIDHQRVPFLSSIVREFGLELDRRMGFDEAEIISARELSDPEKQEVVAKVGKLTGRQVRPRYKQDQSILGGAIIRIGSTIYDGSVRGQLERIRESIVGASS
ncbi:MAG: ATP synthase F1 subunit delta [Acidobacteriales bacterium]|nr:ATP synthase F1 subunit delta [Terriglobales bacterium]